MTYKINKTDGSLLYELADSQIDQTSTDITLIGKNVSGYGEFINENFVKILENFASSSQPNNPITGQLWFDTAENRLKVYDGNGFKIGAGPLVQGTKPLNLVQGDLWIDNLENQLYFYDGTDLQLAGPVYKDSQGLSGFTVETIIDSNAIGRTIVKMWVAQALIGIWSKETVPFQPQTAIVGFSGFIYPGFNASTLTGLVFNAKATKAEALVSTTNFGTEVLKTVDSFMSTEENTSTVGTVTIANSIPLKLGAAQNTEIRADSSSLQIINNNIGQDIIIKVKPSALPVDALVVRSLNRRVGLFNNNPQAMLHVGTPTAPGNVIIEGDLTVNGATTTISSTNLSIQDKNIILANGNASDAGADGAGITIKGTTDKTILWNDTTDAFDISEHINLPAGKTIRINGNQILSATALASSVASAPGLINLATQPYLQVDGLLLDGNRISTVDSNADIELDASGTGNIALIGSPRITGLANPVNPQDSSTKSWTEAYVKSRPLALTIDITGLTELQILSVINDVAPAELYEENTEARVHCTEISVTAFNVPLTSSTSPDLSGTFIKYYKNVLSEDGSTIETVLEDFDASPATTGVTTSTVSRSLKLYRIESGTWTWVEDLTSSV